MSTGLQVTLTFHLPGSLVFLLTQLIMLYQAKQFNTDTLFAIQQLSIVDFFWYSVYWYYVIMPDL